MTFKPAVRTKLKARIALCGPTDGGKTFTALRVARPLSISDNGKGRIAVIDTEYRSASKYIGESPDGWPFQFDVDDLTDFSPQAYLAAILLAGKQGFDVLIIDSLSHAWMGEGGILSVVDAATDRSRSKNKFTEGWREATPLHNKLVDAIIRSPCHIIACMRSKMDYDFEVDPQTNKKVPVKIGMGPIQRAGIEYEFDIVGDLDQQHVLKVTKSRCPAISGKSFIKPGADFIEPVIQWLAVGSDAPEGYYAVNEDDLVAVEKARKEAEKLQPKKKKSAKELIAERQAGEQQPTGASPAPEAPARVVQGNGAAPVANAGSTTTKPTGDPVYDRATEFANRKSAETTAAARKAMAEAVTESSNGDVPGESTPGAREDKLSEPISETTVDHIFSLLQRLRVNLDVFKRDVLVKQCGVERVSQLTKQQGIELMQQLRGLESKTQIAEKFDSESAAKGDQPQLAAEIPEGDIPF